MQAEGRIIEMVERSHSVKKKIYQWYIDRFTIEGDYNKCLLPDKLYLKLIYKKRMGRELNLRNPQTFTEKQNWLKLYDRRPEYHMMADKYAVREYIAKTIGEEYLVPLLGCGKALRKLAIY